MSLTYSQAELKELRKCADPVTGPLYFLTHHFYIQHPVHGAQLYDPFPAQLELIDNYHIHRLNINLMSRQMGKTVTAAGYLMWYAIFKPDQTIVAIANKLLGSFEILDRIKFAYDALPDYMRPKMTQRTKGALTFDNGSRILGRAMNECAIRGMAISLLYLDEFAFVQHDVAAQFWHSAMPSISTGGRVIITSTFNTAENMFSELWDNSVYTDNGFTAFKATWKDHPDRDAKWAANELKMLGQRQFDLEHNCTFEA